MYWANFLHIYQPPNQKKSILKRVVNESYRKLVNGLLANPQIKLTLNINGGLTEMLWENNYKDVIDSLRILLERNQVELTSTAKYHPLLPKIPEEEVKRQIKLNEKTNKKYFGKAYKPKGFFFPEMGYTPRLEKIIVDLGFKWTILDETALPSPVNYSKTYQGKSGLFFFFRERKTSFMILSAQLGTAKALAKQLGSRVKKNEYLLTAMDGETFGHHRPGLENLLWKICNEPKFTTVTISQLPSLFPEKIIVEPKESSWALINPTIARTNPFIRWADPQNEIQKKQWQLLRLAIKTVKRDGRRKTRKLLDKSMYSDQFWWASAKPWWGLEIIEGGAYGLLKIIESCRPKDPKNIQKAKNLYFQIISLGFEWQRTGKVDRLAKKEDEEIRERLRASKPFLSAKEYQQIIKTLTGQMLKAARHQEYARAEQLKKRIEELQEEKKKAPSHFEGEITVNM